MSSPRRFSLRRVSASVLAPGVLALLLLAVLAYVGLRGLDTVAGEGELIVSRDLAASERIALAAARTRALDRALYRLALAQDTLAQGTLAQSIGVQPADIPAALARIAQETAQLAADLRQFRDEFALPEQVPMINHAIAALAPYPSALPGYAAALAHGDGTAAAAIEPFDALLNNLAGLLLRMTDARMLEARRISHQANDITRRTGRTLLGITVIIAGSISLLAWRFGKRQQSVLMTTQALESEVAARTADLTEARVQAETALAEVQRTRRQLVDAEQMAALGALVAGIAHEINTPVGTALTAATLLQDRTRQFAALAAGGALKKTDLTRYLDTASETTFLMLSNIHRAAGLIQSFKQVAVDQTSAERRPFDLSIYLDEVITSLTPQLRKHAVAVTIDCPPGLEMESYPGALSQVITNLVMNALTHAFTETTAPSIHITASPAQDGQIRLHFADNGGGIPQANLPRIFEPFFTTKRGAGGTGLGLHIVYNIVAQKLLGTLAVESAPSTGTRFTITLPVRVG